MSEKKDRLPIGQNHLRIAHGITHAPRVGGRSPLGAVIEAHKADHTAKKIARQLTQPHLHQSVQRWP